MYFDPRDYDAPYDLFGYSEEKLQKIRIKTLNGYFELIMNLVIAGVITEAIRKAWENAAKENNIEDVKISEIECFH